MAAAGTAGDTTENSDYTTYTALDSGSGPSNVTAKIIKHIFCPTDLAELGSQENLGVMVGKMLGEAMDRKIDYDLTQLFSGLDYTVAGAGTSLALAHFDSAMQQLKAAFAPGPYNAVLSTKQIWGAKGISAIFPTYNNYRSTMGFPGTPAGELAQNGFTSQVLGFNIYCDPIITTIAGDDDPGAFISREALVYVHKKDFVYETDRDGSLGNTEHIGWVGMKCAEFRDTHGVYCLSDVS